MTSQSLRSVREGLDEFVDRANKHHERVVITKNGAPAAVLMDVDDLAALEESLVLLSDAVAIAGLADAETLSLPATSFVPWRC